jgi:cyclophilin family peptidyl-prolyl cis-trans isomerase
MKPRTWILGIVLALLVGFASAYYLFGENSSTPVNSAPEAAAQTTAPSGETSATVPTPAPTETAAAAQGTPDLTADANGLSKAMVKITTQHGVIKYRFYSNDAPKTVARMIELIRAGFYNGLTFHRVLPGFVAQGGDPQGNGTGGSGQRLKAEFNERRHVEGAVAMARANDPDSADSQFYITLAPQPHLDRNYTVFGQVVEGMDVVRKLQVGDKMTTVTVE